MTRANQVLGGRCELVDLIGTGSNGEVYRAFDEVFGRLVAAKVLVHGDRETARSHAELARERQGRFEHPNLAGVLDSFDAGDSTVVLTELAPHGTLADLLGLRPELVGERALDIALDVLAGLQALHDRDVIHGDLHTRNVLAVADPEEGLRCVVTDFGSSTARGRARTRGSSAVIAPEVWLGKTPGPKSDLYAAGQLLRGVLRDEAARSVHRRRLGPIVDALTAEDPGDRPADAEEALGVIQALGPEPAGPVVLPSVVPPLPHDWKPTHREPERTRVAPHAWSHQFVGRRVELEALQSRWRDASGGRGGGVVLVGAAGVGKSRLAWHLSRLVGDALVVSAQCSETSGVLEPWQSLVRSVIDVFGSDVVSARLGGDVIPLVTLDPRLRTIAPSPATAAAPGRPETQAALGALLRVAAAEGPILAIIEDLHHATEEAHELFRGLAQALADEPILLVTTMRPPPIAADGPVEIIELRDLASDDVAMLVAAVTGEDDLRFADSIIERAGGNPYFIVELSRVLSEGGSDEIPTTVLETVLHRIADLGGSARDALEVAALIGPHPTVGVLARATGRTVDELTGLVDAACMAELAEWVDRKAGTFRFAHDIARESLVAAVAADRRPRLHFSIAEALRRELGNEPEVLSNFATHLEQAGAGPPSEEALVVRVAAWQLAGDAQQIGQAIPLGTLALGLALRLANAEVVGRLGREVGDQCERVGDYDAALRCYASAFEVAATPIDVAAVLRRQGYVLEKAGRYEESLSAYAAARAALTGESPGAARDHLMCGTMLGEGVTRFYLGDFEESRERSLEGLETAGRCDDDRLVAQAYLQLEMVASELHLPERAMWAERAVEGFEQLDDPVGLGNLLLNLGVSLLNEGAWPEALKSNRDAIDAYDRGFDVVGAAIAQNNEAEILTAQGRLRDARWRLVQAQETFHATGYAMGEALATSGLSRVALHTGRSTEARRLLERALAMFQELEAVNFVYDSLVRLLELHLYTHDLQAAAHVAHRALELEEEVGTIALIPIRLRRLLAIDALLRADRERMADLLDEAEDRARVEEAPSELGFVLHAIIESGRRSDAALHEELSDITSRLGIVWLPPLPVG